MRCLVETIQKHSMELPPDPAGRQATIDATIRSNAR